MGTTYSFEHNDEVSSGISSCAPESIMSDVFKYSAAHHKHHLLSNLEPALNHIMKQQQESQN